MRLLCLRTCFSGVWHAEELNYIFYIENLPVYFLPSDSPEKQTVDRFTTLLTNFAKTGYVSM